jgi:hypothetical protein
MPPWNFLPRPVSKSLYGSIWELSRDLKMLSNLLILRFPILFGAGALAGWLGARYELGGVTSKGETRTGALLVRARTLQYAVSFYLILATIAFCGGGLYASHFWRSAKAFPSGLLTSGIQALLTGALASCLSALYFIQHFSDKHGLDIW